MPTWSWRLSGRNWVSTIQAQFGILVQVSKRMSCSRLRIPWVIVSIPRGWRSLPIQASFCGRRNRLLSNKNTIAVEVLLVLNQTRQIIKSELTQVWHDFLEMNGFTLSRWYTAQSHDQQSIASGRIIVCVLFWFVWTWRLQGRTTSLRFLWSASAP